MLAAGVYLLSHTGANFGSIANHLARDRLRRDDDELGLTYRARLGRRVNADDAVYACPCHA